jgi:hypothetical protein
MACHWPPRSRHRGRRRSTTTSNMNTQPLLRPVPSTLDKSSCRCCCSPCHTFTAITKRLICRCDYQSLLTIMPLIFFAITFEISATFIMGIVGRFEEAVTGNHKVEFMSALFDALIICACIALQKAAICILKDVVL